ncbi:DNA methyltransferase dim-2 [Niveomyces insectorum RCEF 264]|uniref:DNA (cytosine-5-)-methyltransferase n=1 Tax=Niveomyces insectorum RCEF 264 TaxID=1081102 RepID=A0A162MU61_9HYPO|nr:DNA methyltransferase dim-2 [Niveomyces insectorum RCEF 264]
MPEDGGYQCVPINAVHDAPLLRQGFNPATPIRRLRALELFCGCGNLGRGLEDAGVTETRCANDIWPVAMHTFMANVVSPNTVTLFIGSADTFLERVIRRSSSSTSTPNSTGDSLPVPGDIDFISGGSPCQGFSMLTADKSTPQQFKIRSMVASFASFVDVYRPKFGILEDVVNIVKGGKTPTKGDKKNHDAAIHEDTFGQLMCSLLGLRYQLRIMLGNTWSYSAPQQRQRVFLLFAAPGFRLQTSHCLRTWITDASSADMPTAFPCVSAQQATADLSARDGSSKIEDGMVDIYVCYPDHRITAGTELH